MSMKRSRRASNTTKHSEAEGPLSFGAGDAEAPKSWDELVGAQPDGSFKPYALASTFSRNDLLEHPKFGRGVVTRVDGPRVEVLFKDGARKLAHAVVSA